MLRWSGELRDPSRAEQLVEWIVWALSGTPERFDWNQQNFYKPFAADRLAIELTTQRGHVVRVERGADLAMVDTGRRSGPALATPQRRRAVGRRVGVARLGGEARGVGSQLGTPERSRGGASQTVAAWALASGEELPRIGSAARRAGEAWSAGRARCSWGPSRIQRWSPGPCALSAVAAEGVCRPDFEVVREGIEPPTRGFQLSTN